VEAVADVDGVAGTSVVSVAELIVEVVGEGVERLVVVSVAWACNVVDVVAGVFPLLMQPAMRVIDMATSKASTAYFTSSPGGISRIGNKSDRSLKAAVFYPKNLVICV